MESRDVIVALGALAQESRLTIFRMLVKRGPEGFTPGEIAERLAIPAATLSFHLRELQLARLAATRREGRFIYYSANLQQMDEVMCFLTDNCCTLSSTPRDSKCVPKVAAARKKRA
jgi:ArsR family transcriptional regulator, arsenate/arsenite/antimonite-responsive transcriptional repressor